MSYDTYMQSSMMYQMKHKELKIEEFLSEVPIVTPWKSLAENIANSK